MADPRGPETRTPDLDDPPAPDVGTIEAVDLEYRVPLAADHHTQYCQACGELVRWNEVHVLAMVRIEDGIGSGHYVRPVFCDASCWSEWVGRH